MFDVFFFFLRRWLELSKRKYCFFFVFSSARAASSSVCPLFVCVFLFPLFMFVCFVLFCSARKSTGGKAPRKQLATKGKQTALDEGIGKNRGRVGKEFVRC